MRAYVLKFKQAWTEANWELCERLIKETDFCIEAPQGIHIGQRYTTYILQDNDNKEPIPKEVVCTGHEYDGKVVIVEPVIGY
ncbi:MAG TPA: hypothetical protein VF077_09820 [Nitrospiraceae bacterium]